MTQLVENLNKAISNLGGVIGQAVTSLKEQKEIEESISRLNFLADSLKAALPGDGTAKQATPPGYVAAAMPTPEPVTLPIDTIWTPPPGYEAGEIEAKEWAAETAAATQDSTALPPPDVADAPAETRAETLIMETGTPPCENGQTPPN